MKKWLSTFLFILAFRQAKYRRYKVSDYLNDISFRLYSHFRYYNLKGAIELQKGHLDQAMIMYKNSLKMGKNAEAYFEIANILFKNDSLKEAIEHYYKSLELVPNNLDAWINLNAIYLKSGNYEKLEENLFHLEGSEYQSLMEFLYAKVYLELGKLDLAKPFIDKVILCDSITGFYLLAIYYNKKNNIKEAKEIIDQIDEKNIREKVYDEYMQLKSEIYRKFDHLINPVLHE